MSGGVVDGRGELLAKNDPRHGTVNGYCNLRCHCDACRRAWRDHRRHKRYNLTPRRVADRKAKYAMARAAGYSSVEAARRRHWSDPLREVLS